MNMTEFARAYGTLGPKILIAELIGRIDQDRHRDLVDAVSRMATELTEALEEFVK